MSSSGAEASTWHSVRRAAVGLGLFGVVTAGLIALTGLFTADAISAARSAAEIRMLAEVVPAEIDASRLPAQRMALPEPEALGFPEGVSGWQAGPAGSEQVTFVVLPWRSPSGYSGEISGIAGIRADGSLSGVRVTQHQETPGLGDRIERRKSEWILGFADRSLSNPTTAGWRVRKDGGEFDQMTGATITPRAVVAAIHATLEYAGNHHESLFGANP